jgi:AcrR family transcriptional regulator
MQREIRTFSNDEVLVQQRRKEIVQFATKLFVKNGYDRTTMDELADALSTSKGGLYHYIGSKEDILHLIIHETLSAQQEYLMRIKSRIETLSPVEAFQEAFKSLVQVVDEYQDMYVFNNHVMVNLGRDDRHTMFNARDELVAFFESLLLMGIEAVEFTVDDVHLLADSTVVLAHQWAQGRWTLRQRYSLSEFSEKQVKFILKAILVHGG